MYEAKNRDAGNKIQMKTFPGGSVTFTGANSPTKLAGSSARGVFMDEIDQFPAYSMLASEDEEEEDA